MRENVIKLVSTTGVALGIFVVYSVFIVRCAALSDWSNMSQLEELILVTQIIRVGAVASLGRLFRIPPLFSIILFSFEAFLIPLLAPFVILTNDPYYAALMGSILTTWLGVSSILLSPYAIYEFAKSMMNESSLASIMVIAALEMGGMLFLSGVVSTVTGTISGPSALGTLLLQLGRSQISVAGFSGIASSDFISIGLVVFFVGTVCYFSLVGFSKIRISDRLLVALASTVAGFVWIFLFSTLTTDYFAVFTIPAAVGITILWVTTHVN